MTESMAKEGKRASLRDAINGKCKECIYDPKSGLGTWRQQVAGCLCTDCSLYEVRPMPKESNNG